MLRKRKRLLRFFVLKRKRVCYNLLGGRVTGQKSVYIPRRGEEDTQSSRARGCPVRSFFLDLRDEGICRWGCCVEDAFVAVLPGHPGDQQRRGGDAFLHRLGRGLSCRAPPVCQGVLAFRRVAGKAQPGEDFMPHQLGEGAC